MVKTIRHKPNFAAGIQIEGVDFDPEAGGGSFSGNFTEEPTIDGLQEFRRIHGKGFRQYNPAIAGREWTPMNMVWVADSMGEGEGALNRSGRWMSQLVDSMQNLHKTGSDGFIPARQGTAQSWPADWTVTGAPDNTDYGFGLGRRAVLFATGADSIQRTHFCDRFYVLYTSGPSTGTLRITIDGVASTVVTTDALTISGRIWDSGPLPLGDHIIKLDNSAGVCVVDGVAFFETDTLIGIHCWDGSHSGYTSLNFHGATPAETYWADFMFQPHTVFNTFTGVTSAGGTTLTFGAAHGLDANDIGEVIYSGTDVTTFPRGVRIATIVNATQITVNKTVPAGTHAFRTTRSRVTDMVGTNPSAPADLLKGATLTSASMAFNPWDVGKTVHGTNIPTGAIIRYVNSPTSITITKKLSTNVGSGGTLQIINRQKYPMRPHLLGIELGFNEMQNSLPASVFGTGVEGVVNCVLETGQLDHPGLPGIYNDERPSVTLLGLWAPSHTLDVGIAGSVTSGNPTITAIAGSTPHFNDGDIGKTITAVGNNPIPAGTTITAVAPDGMSATMSNNANANNASFIATIVQRQYQDVMWQPYRAQMAELAETYNWVFYDLYTLGGYIGDDVYGLTHDGLHASPRGHKLITDELSKTFVGTPRTGGIPRGTINSLGEILVGAGIDEIRTAPGFRRLNAEVATVANHTNLRDLTEWATMLGPNKEYSGIFVLLWTCATATTGINFDFNPSAGMSAPSELTLGAAAPATSATTIQWVGRLDAAWGTDLLIPASAGNASIPVCTILGFGFKTGAVGGLLTPRFGAETNVLATVRKGSFLLMF